MKQKLYIGLSVDLDVGCGNILTFTQDEILSISKSEKWGWTLITVGCGDGIGCAYDLTDLKVIEGEFTISEPEPSDSKS